MTNNESSGSEFDQETERVLRDHFEAEASELRAPGDTWARLESRMEETMPQSFFSRLMGFLSPTRGGRLYPAIAAAGVAVIAVAVAVVTLTLSGGDGGQGPEGGLVSVVATERPEATSVSVVESPTTVAMAQSESRQSPSEAGQPTPALSAPIKASDATPAPAMAPTTQAPTPPPLATVLPTAAPTSAPTTTAAPVEVPTPAPMATAAPMAMAEQLTEAEYDGAMAMAVPASQTASSQSGSETAAMVMRGSRCGSDGAPKCPPTPAAIEQPSDTTFRNYQRQPFVAASEDNVSTFSLDTDRTSLQLALTWARAGYQVNPDSVRAEEWLNAFNYEYDSPPDSTQFAIGGELFPHPLEEDKRLARISFQAPELVDDKPLNVTLVMDASGSMADGDRVGIARAAAESIRQSLRGEDRIAVVHFTTDVLERYTVNHSAPDDEDVIQSIRQLQPHDSTNVQAGLNLGVRMADDARESRPDAYNYVILMSDGVANVDATNPFAILETAYDPQTLNPLRLITVGVGIGNFNDPLMEQLAQHGNGWYRYLDTREQAQATFSRDNWLALSVPFADQTRAQVTWDAESVERWRIIGYENRVTDDELFTQDRREFAEIYSGAATTVLYELELTEGARSQHTVSLGQVEVRWVDPASGESRSQRAALSGDSSGAFDGQGGPLAHFGAIVALAADLYGKLTITPADTEGDVHAGLSTLLEQLDSLEGQLGELDSYQDFRFLLEHITGDVQDRLPPSTPSGYSR